MVSLTHLYLKLIEQYIEGWKENDLQKILLCLKEDCVVIESHGPIYYGIEGVKQWFDFWIKANSYINWWRIDSFHCVEEKNIAFVEWDFSCISNDTEYAFIGISVVKFSKEKIAVLQEYRMTNRPYIWGKNKLISE